MTSVLIVGATSAMAQAVARRFATEGAALFLTARDDARLATLAADLSARGAASVETLRFDADDFDAHEPLVEAAWGAFPTLDYALVAYGTLPDQEEAETDAEKAVDAFRTNATSVVALLTHLANRFEAQGSGTLAVISSVAGDRGRPSNYVYGAAKGAVSLFTGGLRARLAPAVRVVTIKPGLVDTPMTAHLSKTALFADADTVGEKIYRAMKRGTPVAYVPGFWRGVMGVIRAIPERVFARLDL